MLSAFRWYRRWLGGTWQNGDRVEHWEFDAGSMSPQWMEARAEKTAEQKRLREQERIDAFHGLHIVKWRSQ